MAQFPSTQWSLIRRSGETPSARRQAFGELAGSYRSAIAAYFRARMDASAVEDATQGFLAASFEHAWWSRADAECGSFRGFLLLLLRRHLGHLRELRRLDEMPMNTTQEHADPAVGAEHQFDTRFALVLTARALDGLRQHYAGRGRGELFERIVPLLSSPPEYGELTRLAETLGMPGNTLTVEIKRLRSRLRERLREDLMDLCADQVAFDSEWSTLQQILGGA